MFIKINVDNCRTFNFDWLFHVFLVVFICFYSNFALAENVSPDSQWPSSDIRALCLEKSSTSIPQSDQPDELTKKKLAHCNAEDFYYGIYQKQDWNKARECAFLSQDFSVLTMIYANGYGVPRNWDLAIHFACEAGFAPAEVEARVNHLIALRDGHGEGKDFDICDDVTSGYMMGKCTSHMKQLAQAKRSQELAALTQAWSEQDKSALEKLQRAAGQFFLVRSHYEVDLSGTARASLEMEEQISSQNEFLASLKSLMSGHLPAYSEKQQEMIDKNLNEIYQKIESDPDFSLGTIDRESVKKTQLAWLKYRQAWINFGKIKYPQVDERNWQAWLAEKRIKMLQDLADAG